MGPRLQAGFNFLFVLRRMPTKHFQLGTDRRESFACYHTWTGRWIVGMNVRHLRRIRPSGRCGDQQKPACHKSHDLSLSAFPLHFFVPSTYDPNDTYLALANIPLSTPLEMRSERRTFPMLTTGCVKFHLAHRISCQNGILGSFDVKIDNAMFDRENAVKVCRISRVEYLRRRVELRRELMVTLETDRLILRPWSGSEVMAKGAFTTMSWATAKRSSRRRASREPVWTDCFMPRAT